MYDNQNFKFNKGLTTIETALIFPLVLFSIWVLFYVGLFFMDYAKCIFTVNQVLSCASLSVEKCSDIGIGTMDVKERKVFGGADSIVPSSYVQRRIQEKLDKRLLLIQIDSVRVAIHTHVICAQISWSSSGKIFSYFHLPKLKGTIQQKVEQGDFSKRLRKASVKKETMEDFDALEKEEMDSSNEERN